MQFQVPNHDEAPSEEFIEFLNDLDIEWSGDECGIIFGMSPDDVTALPGDTVTFNPDGSVSVTKGITQDAD